ncbi:MAG: diphosphomevalonate decarboxylase [Acidobacteriota bacterium]
MSKSAEASTAGTSSAKCTVRSPSNIAFIKYWGAKDLEQAIPVNPSLSMTLTECFSRSTVEWVEEAGEHEIWWRATDGSFEDAPPAFAERVRGHFDFLRRWAKVEGRFRLATENSFPAAAGLASSASGFSAMTLATLGALGRQASAAEKSALARLSGSGSASRSVLGGYVEWPDSTSFGAVSSRAQCYARQIQPADHWDLRNVIAVVERGAKSTSSLDGHRRAQTSPYFHTRQRRLPGRLKAVRRAIEKRDFTGLGQVIETEAIDLHCVAMTSDPAIFYWSPATLVVLAAVRAMREDGVEAYSTMDAGANVHVICQPEAEAEVGRRLQGLELELSLIHDRVGPGPIVEEDHLF